MRHFGTYTLRMKHLSNLRTRLISLSVLTSFIAGLTAWPDSALSQNEAMSLINADIVFRTREIDADPKNAEARVELAIALERKKDFAAVITTLAPHKDKIGRAGLVVLARSYGKTNQFTEAVTTLELANARSPKNAQLQTLLGQAISRAGRKEAAIETLYKAKATNPKYIPAYDALLEELVKGESRQEARDLLSDMVKKFKMKPRWASELCHLYVLDAFHEKAVESCKEALIIDSGNPMNAVNLANSYREQSKPEKAKALLIKTASRVKRSEPVQTALGDYFKEGKNYVDAYKWYKAAVKSDPKSFGAQIGLAQAALELQKMEDSIAAFTAACRLSREAIREFQSGLIKIRNRGDTNWQRKFEEAISSHCQILN
jgi:tetratricopeptide (TPR) repeat protein